MRTDTTPRYSLLPLRVQGIHSTTGIVRRELPSTPALAGHPSRGRSRAPTDAFYPCVCRETERRPTESCPCFLSPLRTQGTRYVMTSELKPDPFTPAHAGKPASRSSTLWATTFHPCIRRETAVGRRHAARLQPFTPAYAGKPESVVLAARLAPFTPAYAGKPSPGRRNTVPRTFHPCIRRETQPEQFQGEALVLSPLHTQGNRRRVPSNGRVLPFTPAYAGKPLMPIRLNSREIPPTTHRQNPPEFEPSFDSTAPKSPLLLVDC